MKFKAENEIDFFAKYGIEYVDDKTYRVPSSSGNGVYTVRWEGRGDLAGEVNLWSCDCKAGQHNRPCKHWRIVASAVGEWCDMNGWE